MSWIRTLFALACFLSASVPCWAQAADPSDAGRPWYVTLMRWILGIIITFVVLYLVRHYIFTLNRLFGRQRYPYIDLETADWPAVTVLVPAHNEESVIQRILQSLLECDYPQDRLVVIPVNDRSEDKTGDLIEEMAAQHPHLIRPFHRREGAPGKAAALNDAMQHVETDVVLVFDADYVPGQALIRQLVAPFFDPEVGAVMGRVVPSNVDENLLTRLLDLERSGGYQVDQQARMNLNLVPQYGGTVGGVRRRALEAVGGWRDDALAEDTDITFRLLMGGWRTVYQNRSECYEEVPHTWPNRIRQVTRWARGHNQCLSRYFTRLVTNRRLSLWERLDGAMLLGVYLMSPVLLVGWTLALALWYLGENEPGLIIVLLVASYSTIGNFATFFEVASATHLDGTRYRARLIPFILMGFLVTLVAVTRGTLRQLFPQRRREALYWHKTERYGDS